MKTYLRKTGETIWEAPLSNRTHLSTNPLFLSNFFMTPPLCPNLKNENPPPPASNFRGRGNYAPEYHYFV